MKTLLAAFAVAVLVAAIVTQLAATAFPGQYPVLFALVAAGSLLTSWVVLRCDRRVASQAPAPRERRGQRRRQAAVPAPSNRERETGSVKWFDLSKGYGFVIRANGDEIFVHHRSIRGTRGKRAKLNDGQAVSFVAVEGPRGWQAEDVEPTDQ